MKKNLFIFLLGIFSVFSAFSQTVITGSVKDAINSEPIPDVIITIEETSQTTRTDAFGEFSFKQNVPLGNVKLEHVKQLVNQDI